MQGQLGLNYSLSLPPFILRVLRSHSNQSLQLQQSLLSAQRSVLVYPVSVAPIVISIFQDCNATGLVRHGPIHEDASLIGEVELLSSTHSTPQEDSQ